MISAGAAAAATGAVGMSYVSASKLSAEITEIKEKIAKVTPQLQTIMSRAEFMKYAETLNAKILEMEKIQNSQKKQIKALNAQLSHSHNLNLALQEQMESIINGLKGSGIKMEVPPQPSNNRTKKSVSILSHKSDDDTTDESDSSDEEDKKNKKKKKKKGKGKALSTEDLTSVIR